MSRENSVDRSARAVPVNNGQTKFSKNMTILRSDIERGLDDLISNEEGMRFQGLATVLAKQRWPDLIASERKKDRGADAIGNGRALACSTTAALAKLKSDAVKIKANFPHVTELIFSTPQPVSNVMARGWAEEIKKEFGHDLVVVPREDIIISLLEPSNLALCESHLGLAIKIEPKAAAQIQQAHEAIAEATGAWFVPLEGKPLIELRAVRIDEDGRDSTEVISPADASTALSRSTRMVIEAPAGRGKTTTLVQLANKYNHAGGLAFLVDLPGWIRSRKNILQFIADTPPFQSRGITAESLARLHAYRPFSFLLNGWNEIAESDSIPGSQALRNLQKDFPSAGIVVATRTHHLVPPLPGAIRLRLLPLNGLERAAYLETRLGDRANELKFLLNEDAVLDDLTRTPFILSEVVALFEAGEPIPNTKMGILAAAVSLHERSAEHSNELMVAPLRGYAERYLTALALSMMGQGAVTMTDDEARKTISTVSAQMRQHGQIANEPEPITILAALSAHHVLERASFPEGTIRFEHQQYEEFYAALELARVLHELAAKGSGQQILEFTKKFINEPGWAEPLRMVAQDIGIAVAKVPEDETATNAGVLLLTAAFECDSVFGGELSFLAGDSLWKKISADVATRLRAEYARGAQHREIALTAMLATGSDDFRDILNPLLSNTDQQVRLQTYRLWGDFHLSSIGPDWAKTVRGWPQEVRVEFVSDMIHFGNVARTLVPFALADASVKVRTAAIHALAWVSVESANHRLAELDDTTFGTVVANFPAEWLRGSNRQRALTIFRGLYASAGDPMERIQLLRQAKELGDSNVGERLKENLAHCNADQTKAMASFQLKDVLEIIRPTDPEWVSRWVAERIVEGTLWHEHWIGYVTGIPADMREALLTRLETQNLEHGRSGTGMSVLAAVADPAMVKRIFLKLCELRQIVHSHYEQRHELEWAIARQLEGLFRLIAPKVAVEGLAFELIGETDADRQALVCRLFSRVGREKVDLRGELPEDLRQMLRTYLLRAVQVARKTDDFRGDMKADVASALARVGEPSDISILHEIIRADIERVKRGREAKAKGDLGSIGSGATVSYSMWHIRALTLLDSERADSVLLDLLGEAEYERDVPAALVQLARRSDAQNQIGPLIRKTNYKDIWRARLGSGLVLFDEERRKRYGAAFTKEIENMLEEEAQGHEVNNYRIKELAKGLAALDAGGSRDLVMRALKVPGRFNAWLVTDTLETLLFSGISLPAEQTFAVFDQIVQQIGRSYQNSDNERHLLIRALCVLPFVDEPSAGVRKVQETISSLRMRGHELSNVVEAIGHCRCAEGWNVLRALASDAVTARTVGDAWFDALAALNTNESKQMLLSFVDPELSGDFNVEFDRAEKAAARIAEAAAGDSKMRERVLQLCSLRVPEPKRSLLAKVVTSFGTEDSAIASLGLLDDDMQPQVPRDVWQEMENAFVERKPYGEDGSTYTREPRSSNAVRHRLFEMSRSDSQRAKAADTLLTQIEAWRLEYGRPLGEPRSVEVETRIM